MTWTQIGILVGAVLVEIGRAATSGSVSAWPDMLTPPIVGAAILNLGLQLGGVLSKGPNKEQN